MISEKLVRIIAAIAFFTMIIGTATWAEEAKKADTPSPYLAQIDKVEARLTGEFMSLYKKCQAKKIPLDYPTVAKTTLDQFIPLAKYDVEHNHNWRVESAIKDFNRILDHSIATMKAYLADPSSAPVAVRYKTGKVETKDYHFWGKRVDSTGNVDQGPLFFCGYGHFSQVRTDIPRWPGYGVNLIQSAEFGPAQVFTEEGKVTMAQVNDVAKSFDEAAKNNVKIDLLLSPHYFPEWAMKKYPNLGKGGGGFLGFVIDEPEAKKVVEDFLRIVVPIFKDKPALSSFCLSNEPYFDRPAGAENTKPMWGAYLAKLHGNLDKMNERYGTTYEKFEDVPIPQNQNYTAPQFYDYVRFNNQRLSRWHKWMADIIHEMAPGVPVHAKIMGHMMLLHELVAYGVDPEEFGAVSDLNGNDCTFNPDGNVWAAQWLTQNLWYDIQRSLNKKPIFNSENHISIDGNTSYIQPELFNTALWQGAVHGQGATTIWVWERAKEPGEPGYDGTQGFVGNAMDHPACAEAVGTTCLDLNRFGTEVAALQNARSPVAILYSVTSNARDGDYYGSVHQVYEALNFCGVKVDFISEKQLAEGKGINYRMIVVPKANHVTPEAFAAIKSLGKLVKFALVGNCLQKDPYDKPYPKEDIDSILSSAYIVAPNASTEDIWKGFRAQLDIMDKLPKVSVVDATTGEPVWGVEWLPVKVGKRTVINMVNLLSKPVEVKVVSKGKQIQVKNLLSLGGVENVRILKPITPVLAEVEL